MTSRGRRGVTGGGEEGLPSPFTLVLINRRPINPAGASLAGRSGTQKGSGGLRTTTALMLIILVEKKIVGGYVGFKRQHGVTAF